MSGDAASLPFVPSTELGKHTLELLWARTRMRGDMPGFAKAVSSILGAMRGEEEQAFNMTQTVLSDPVLTQKVLRLANSGMYSAFGQSVNTVSKAVLVLGTDAIGHLALGLKLIEELSRATPDSVSAHIEMEKAVLAGMVAQQVAAGADGPYNSYAEEAVVCSMLHTLGRMMLTFYMTDYWAGLQAHGGPGNESAAAQDILGLSLEQLGLATAQHWGLPKNLINGMRTVEPEAAGEGGADISRADWMAGLSTMSSRCANLMWHDDAGGALEVQALLDRYAGMLGLEPEGLARALERARTMAAADLSIAPLSNPADRRARALASTRMRAVGNRVLLSGLAEMRGALDTANPGQMVAMALETVYQGLDFSHAVAFVRNHKERRYVARMSLGADVKQLLPLMAFGEAYQPNVFHAALNSDRVIFIENAHDPKFAAKLPLWWQDTLSTARSFVILPLVAKGQPAGFLYGDWDDSYPPVQLSQIEFGLLNEVRALVVQAVQLRHRSELAANRVD